MTSLVLIEERKSVLRLKPSCMSAACGCLSKTGLLFGTAVTFGDSKVAPIIGPGVSTPLRQTYDFWAIGRPMLQSTAASNQS